MALVVLAGCSSAPPPRAALPPVSLPPVSVTTAPPTTAPPTSVPPTTATLTPTPAPPPTTRPAPSCATTVLAGLDPTERAAQLLMVGVPAGDPGSASSLVADGAVGGVFLRGRSTRPLTAVATGVATLQDAAGAVPLLVSADQEGGQVQTLSGAPMPSIGSGVAQGRLTPAVLAAQTRDWAAALVSAGVTLNLGPVADVVPAGTAEANPPIGAVDRQLGATPTAVSAAVTTIVGASRDAGLLSTAKHFPGLGRVTVNTDTGTGAADPATTATDAALTPFADAVHAGVAAVMVSSASYPQLDPDHLAVFSPTVITGLLRERLGFTGLVISDDVGSAAAVQSVAPGQRAVQLVAAGGDVVLTVRSSDVAPMTAALVQQAADSAGFRALVDAAVTRVLDAKVAAGTLRC